MCPCLPRCVSFTADVSPCLPVACLFTCMVYTKIHKSQVRKVEGVTSDHRHPCMPQSRARSIRKVQQESEVKWRGENMKTCPWSLAIALMLLAIFSIWPCPGYRVVYGSDVLPFGEWKCFTYATWNTSKTMVLYKAPAVPLPKPTPPPSFVDVYFQRRVIFKILPPYVCAYLLPCVCTYLPYICHLECI